MNFLKPYKAQVVSQVHGRAAAEESLITKKTTFDQPMQNMRNISHNSMAQQQLRAKPNQVGQPIQLGA